MEKIDPPANIVPILTVQEVAAYLRFSEAKVYQMARAGHLPAARIGRAWRFRKDMIDAWLMRSIEKNLEAEESVIPAI